MKQSRISAAATFADNKHMGQKRKFTGDDYITHPVQVAEFVKQFGGTENMIIAALLHDVLEDTNGTYAEIEHLCGKTVANIVVELTTDDIEDKSLKGRILANKMTRMSPDALTVKLCDRLHNVREFGKASKRFIEKYKAETELILNTIDGCLQGNQIIIANEIRKTIQKF